MLDTSGRKFLSLGKIRADDFNRIRFSSASHQVFPVYFLPRPAVLTSEGDGWTSLCSFVDRRAGITSVLVYFGFVLVQGFSTACAQKCLWLLEKLFFIGLKWKQTLRIYGL